MLHRILSVLDNHSKGDVFSVVANMIDWNNAFPRQCPKLGIESFIQNGVCPSLIPVLLSRQENVHQMAWCSVPKHIKGGGRSTRCNTWITDYQSQSNHGADCVDVKDRFKFVDDLSILEIVNLITAHWANIWVHIILINMNLKKF
jgi:hypothetical protein